MVGSLSSLADTDQPSTVAWSGLSIATHYSLTFCARSYEAKFEISNFKQKISGKRRIAQRAEIFINPVKTFNEGLRRVNSRLPGGLNTAGIGYKT